jgi:hypothetical protein
MIAGRIASDEPTGVPSAGGTITTASTAVPT